MQTFHPIGMLLLVALLPIPILAYGSTVHSIIDSILEDAPQYLAANVEKTQVQSVGSLVRSCPLSFYETLLNGAITYTISSCINATGLILIPPTNIAKKVEIERTKLDISLQVKKGVRLGVKLELSAPIFDGAYAYTWLGRIPIGWFKSLIISDAKQKIESELWAFLKSLA